MSARHRHHKNRLAEAKSDIASVRATHKATTLVMAYLLEHGHSARDIAYHTLEHVLVNLEHDEKALLEILNVLAPGDMWRFRFGVLT